MAERSAAAARWRKELRRKPSIPNSRAIVRKNYKYIFYEDFDPHEELDLWNVTGE